jgi:hypothetical protein
VVSPRAAGARVTVNNESIGAGNNHETMAGVHSSFAVLFSHLFSGGARNSVRGHKRNLNKGTASNGHGLSEIGIALASRILEWTSSPCLSAANDTARIAAAYHEALSVRSAPPRSSPTFC